MEIYADLTRESMNSMFYDSSDYYLDHTFHIGPHNIRNFSQGKKFGVPVFQLGKGVAFVEKNMKKNLYLRNMEVHYFMPDTRSIYFPRFNIGKKNRYDGSDSKYQISPIHMITSSHLNIDEIHCKIPDSVSSINLTGNRIKRLKNLPRSMRNLILDRCPIEELPEFEVDHNDKIIISLIGCPIDKEWIDYAEFKFSYNDQIKIIHMTPSDFENNLRESLEEKKRESAKYHSPYGL